MKPPEMHARVTSDPRICGGRPCITGTRMRVSDIVEMLAHGATRQEILADFPYLSDQDITAAHALLVADADVDVVEADHAPPPAVSSHAAPLAFASSRTRRM